MPQLRVLDLFSGIGGFSLGLERAGMRTVAFCEIEPYCRAVLRKHWPDIPIFEDVRLVAGSSVRCEVICGGFPCQDISYAGEGGLTMTAKVETIYAAIGMRVRFIREAVGMKQEDLAKAIGQTRTSLVNFENGKQRCMLHNIEAMAKALNTTPKHLLRGLWT